MKHKLSPRFRGAYERSLCILLLVSAIALSSCGSGTSASSQNAVSLSGNWQFMVASPTDESFLGGLQGGFLLQQAGSVTGSVEYAVALPPAQASGNPIVCSSGSAAITGTVTGQSVMLTAIAGTQTFMFTGTLSFDGSTMVGTYTSTTGTAPDGSGCGTSQTGLQWSAALVQPLTGSILGSFHSTGGAAGLNEEDFLVSGSLTQAENTGASSANITGNLSFLNETTNHSDYPCISNASVSGQISGNTVLLQITGSDGSNIGQIGASAASGLQTVTFDPTQNGYVLQSLGAPAYAVYSTACGGGSITSPADSGNICLAVNSTTACLQPLTLTPAALVFPAQTTDTSARQTITLTNISSSAIGGLSLTLTNQGGADSFTESDNCGVQGVASQGEAFSLLTQQSCVITIIFTPECGNQCSAPLAATLNAISPNNDTIYTLPISGTAASANAESTFDFDFDVERIPVSSLLRKSPERGRQEMRSSNRQTSQDLEHHAEIE